MLSYIWYIQAYTSHMTSGTDESYATRAQSLMKMLRRVENEKFTFKIDTEIALVDCTIGTLVPTVELAS